MIEQILETWEIQNRINFYLLDGIAEEHLQDVLASKGRNVGEQFAHIHNVRLMWIDAAHQELMAGLSKIAKGAPIDKNSLESNLTESGAAIGKLLRYGFETGRIKGFKPHPLGFLGYLIAHEAHHRSQIIIALKQSGHPVGKKIGFGMWEWGVR